MEIVGAVLVGMAVGSVLVVVGVFIGMRARP